VASKLVGFEIYNSGKFSDKNFVCFIHLWGNGGPNWIFEERKYYIEQDQEWKTIVNSKRKSNTQKSVFDRLEFPEIPQRVSQGSKRNSVFSCLTYDLLLVFTKEESMDINANQKGKLSYVQALNNFGKEVNGKFNENLSR
jgi:hypothetical protein